MNIVPSTYQAYGLSWYWHKFFFHLESHGLNQLSFSSNGYENLIVTISPDVPSKHADLVIGESTLDFTAVAIIIGGRALDWSTTVE